MTELELAEAVEESLFRKHLAAHDEYVLTKERRRISLLVWQEARAIVLKLREAGQCL